MLAMIASYPLPVFAFLAPLVIGVIIVGWLIIAGWHPLTSRMHIVRVTDRQRDEPFDPTYTRTC